MDRVGGLSARLQAWQVSLVLRGIFQKGTLSGSMKKRLEKKLPEGWAFYDKMLSMFGVGTNRMAFVTKKSIQNQFYSDPVTPLEDSVSVPGTTVHIFYAVEMGLQY